MVPPPMPDEPTERLEGVTMRAERRLDGPEELWRLELVQDGRVVVDTGFKDRRLFLAELAVHLDRWNRFVLLGIGQPAL